MIPVIGDRLGLKLFDYHVTESGFAADIGFDKETAEKLVKPGDRVMLRGTWQSMENGYVTAPALDDRAGCACILEALELLRGKELPCGLTAVFSTREETGGEGAAAAAAAIARKRLKWM